MSCDDKRKRKERRTHSTHSTHTENKGGETAVPKGNIGKNQRTFDPLFFFRFIKSTGIPGQIFLGGFLELKFN